MSQEFEYYKEELKKHEKEFLKKIFEERIKKNKDFSKIELLEDQRGLWVQTRSRSEPEEEFIRWLIKEYLELIWLHYNKIKGG